MMTMPSLSLVCRAVHDSAILINLFIASKCDDISCTEVIRALNLEDDPELEEIENRIDQHNEEMSDWKKNKSQAEKSAKGLPLYIISLYSCADDTVAIEIELKGIREHLHEYEEHLQALKDNKPFTPTLTAQSATEMVAKSKKRKNSRAGKKGSPKKHRSNPDDNEDVSIMSESGSDSDSDSDMDSDVPSDKDSDEETDDESESDSESEESGAGSNVEEITEEDLQQKIKETTEAVKSGRNRLSEARKQKKEAIDYLSTLKKHVTKAQKEKNAFCSLKRSEVNSIANLWVPRQVKFFVAVFS
jgi:hypothetical protein